MKTTHFLPILILCIVLIQDTNAWRRRRRRSDPPPPTNYPPVLHNCPQSLPYQYTTTSTAVVSWSEPYCTDSLSACTTSRSGAGPGSRFSEGSHSIGYTARDTAGLTASGTVSFTVRVIRCSAATAPQHCSVGCTLSNSVGSVCSFTCAAGLTLVGSSQRQCESTGNNQAQWSGTQPTCIDDTAPSLTNCPSSMTVDRTEHWGVEVTFTPPTATDLFDQSLEVLTNPSDLGSPYTFTEDTTCQYNFRDDAGNTAICSFDVTVNDIVVPTFLTCPEGQTIRTSSEMTQVTWEEPTYQDIVGDEVRMTCNYGGNSVLLPWGESHVVYTATNVDNGLSATCEFVMKVEPIPCMTLRTPAHGAISCDKWVYGRYCSMSCNENYDIPMPSPFQPATDVFTCGLTGQWSPHANIPDCSQIRDPTKSQLPTDLLYYADQCGSPMTLNSIAQAFIETITKSDHSDICNMNVDCNIGNVDVKCGWPTRRRRRRNAVVKRRRRQANTQGEDIEKAFEVFDLDSLKDIVPGGLQPMWISMDLRVNATSLLSKRKEAIGSSKKTLLKLADAVFNMFTSTKDLDYGLGLIGRPESPEGEESSNAYLLLGEHTAICPQGYVADHDKLTCVACTTGHYYDPDSQSCLECGFGSYQDGYAGMDCKTCPEGQSTRTRASRDLSECRDQCKAGHFSTSGLSPCIPCPLDMFQPLIGQQQCFECPSQMKTLDQGATCEEQCIHP